MNRLRQFYALAGLTAHDTMRRPITILLAVSAVALTAAGPLILQQALGDEGRIARDGGLALQLVFGLFLAAYAASSQSESVEAGTMAVLLSKPISRPLLLLARFAGLAVVITLFSVSAGIATLLCERIAARNAPVWGTGMGAVDWRTGRWLLLAPFITLAIAGYLNYRTRRPFGSTAFRLLPFALLGVLLTAGAYDRSGAPAAFTLRVDPRILPASILITLALLVLTALALTLATRLRMAPTMTGCTLALVLGLLSDHLFGAARGAWPAIAAAAIPNWQQFWLADALGSGRHIPWSYVGQSGLYAAGLIITLLAAGTLLMRPTEAT